jgi:hypothetical protein
MRSASTDSSNHDYGISPLHHTGSIHDFFFTQPSSAWRCGSDSLALFVSWLCFCGILGHTLLLVSKVVCAYVLVHLFDSQRRALKSDTSGFLGLWYATTWYFGGGNDD